MQTNIASYPWAKELERTVAQSLFTSFGLDFLLFEDKKGGNVDTISNVRQGIWATEEEQRKYSSQLGSYDAAAYHTHNNYIKKGQHDKNLQKQGKLHDPYRNMIMAPNEDRNLDHVISAKEIHNDAGRVLSGADGIELANLPSNLQSTSETINKSKKEKPIDAYLQRLPSLIEEHSRRAQPKLGKEKRETDEASTRNTKTTARSTQARIRNPKKTEKDRRPGFH